MLSRYAKMRRHPYDSVPGPGAIAWHYLEHSEGHYHVEFEPEYGHAVNIMMRSFLAVFQCIGDHWYLPTPIEKVNNRHGRPLVGGQNTLNNPDLRLLDGLIDHFTAQRWLIDVGEDLAKVRRTTIQRVFPCANPTIDSVVNCLGGLAQVPPKMAFMGLRALFFTGMLDSPGYEAFREDASGLIGLEDHLHELPREVYECMQRELVLEVCLEESYLAVRLRQDWHGPFNIVVVDKSPYGAGERVGHAMGQGA